MNYRPLGAALLGAVLASGLAFYSWPKPAPELVTELPPPAEVRFSPKGGCTTKIVEELNRAQNEILIQAYSFTSKPISEALIAAHKRGVVVKGVFDSSNLTARGSQLPTLAKAGVLCWVDHKHAIAHSKVMLIDNETLITGSFNFSAAAENANLENLLILHRPPAVLPLYRNNWFDHQAHADPYRSPAQ